MKIGIFGGTFNPIHKSHMYIAGSFYKELGLSKVLLMPTFIPPHKVAPELADALQRLEMCRLACKDKPYIEVCDYEIKKEGKSYTFETLEWLKETCPQDDLYLIMGSDMFLTIEEWKNPQIIYKLAVICCMAREENEYKKLLIHKDKIEKYGAKVIVLKLEPVSMSSTEIREKIKHGEDVSLYLDDKVEKYIKEHGLYSGDKIEY